MTLDEIDKALAVYLDDSKQKEMVRRLKKFEDDISLMNVVKGKIPTKSLREMQINDLFPVLDLIENYVMIDYPVNNPLILSPIYHLAISSNKQQRFSIVIDHLQQMKSIDDAFLTHGVVENKELDPSSQSWQKRNPFNFSKESYLNHILSYIATDMTEDLAADRLVRLKGHAEALKAKEFDIARLISMGYSNVMMKLDIEYKDSSVDKFTDASSLVVSILETMEKRGFEVYNAENFTKIAEYIDNKRLSTTMKAMEYCHTEAVMYLTGLHIKRAGHDVASTKSK
ncbi:hypothetical protein H6503_06945 [Candidatus Woesearchaeota archaeon]|nr:hypothetical protein [Candidatus Woesearchaeota archaeon]